MDDVISRSAAIDAVEKESTTDGAYGYMDTKSIIDLLEDLPSAQPDLDEWCTDCKEYDHERNCCPRWNRVIRTTVDDLKAERTWIPCSERLPEANQVVLLAFSHNAVVGYWIDILPDGKPIWYAATGNGWATDIDCEDYGYPVAWMPVPDVVKGEQ